MKGSEFMGYRSRTNMNGDLSIKIKDVDLAQRVKDHCKLTNTPASDFVSECVKKCMDSAYSEYLKTLPKDALIEMIIKERKEEKEHGTESADIR